MTRKLRLLKATERRLTAFHRTGDRDQIVAAEALTDATALRELIDTPDESPARVAFALGWFHFRRYELLDSREDLSLSSFFIVSLAKNSIDGPFPAPLYEFQGVLGLGFVAEGNESRRSALRDQGIELLQEAVAVAPVDVPARSEWLRMLSVGLSARAADTGSSADVDAAVDVARAALRELPAEHPDRAPYQSNLGGMLRLRFEYSARSADIDEAVSLCRAAADARDAAGLRRPAHLYNLSLALRERYSWTGNLTDLDEAVAMSRESLRADPDDDAYMYHSSLASALRARFERGRNVSDLEDAVEAATAALAAAPADQEVEVAIMHSNLGNVLRERFRLSAEEADLNRSLGHWQTALGLEIPPGLRHRIELNLANGLQDKHRILGDARSVVEAVILWHGVLAELADTDPRRPQIASNLGNGLWDLYRLTGEAPCLDEAVAMWRTACDAEAAPDQVRVTAGCEMGLVGAEEGDWDLAAEGYTAAVGLVSRLAWRGTPRPNRESQLNRYGGLAALAASSTIAADRTADALVALEQGRAVLWSQLLDTRVEQSALGVRAPELLAHLVLIRDQLALLERR